jgi:cytochrome c oxidase cbb3-type subunit 3
VTPFWTAFIAVLALANIAGCLWLLGWTARKRPGDKPESGTTGHVWDEDLTEWNKPMPRWWLNLFYATVVFALAYLVLFPGLGAFRGTLGWSSAGELAVDVAAAQAKLAPMYAKYEATPVEALAQDDGAVELGRSVFANHCATCHGSDGRGATGFPNLVDADWIWGGEPERVLETVLQGRRGAMPALGAALGPRATSEVAVYVQSLSGQPVDRALAAAGGKHFQGMCIACHGVDGRGNPSLGAPNLTDDVWLHGGAHGQIVETVTRGRTGEMPAHAPLIGAAKARVAAAYVLSRGPRAAGGGIGAAGGDAP